MSTSPSELQDLSDVTDVSLPKRVLHFARSFLDKPYDESGIVSNAIMLSYKDDKSIAENALDLITHFQKPEFSYQFDSFDCVTYVETVLALSFCDSKMQIGQKPFENSEFNRILKRIRYQNGMDSFLCRNHFMSSDWLINNKWFLKDATSLLDYPISRATCTIDKGSWLFKRPDVLEYFEKVPKDKQALLKESITHELGQLNSHFEPTKAAISYIDKEVFLEKHDVLKSSLPEIGLVFIVRPDWQIKEVIGTNLNVSHLGFYYLEHDNLMMMHAKYHDKVVKISLNEYVKTTMLEEPTIGGLQFYTISDI